MQQLDNSSHFLIDYFTGSTESCQSLYSWWWYHYYYWSKCENSFSLLFLSLIVVNQRHSTTDMFLSSQPDRDQLLAHLQRSPARPCSMNHSDKRGSTRRQGWPSSHSLSAHHTGFRRRGPDRCHTHRSGMALASICPCWCTSGRPPCSPPHLLEHTEVEDTLSTLWSLNYKQKQLQTFIYPLKVCKIQLVIIMIIFETVTPRLQTRKCI